MRRETLHREKFSLSSRHSRQSTDFNNNFNPIAELDDLACEACHVLEEIGSRHHLEAGMMDAPETKLIEALKRVDAHGDVAPYHVHDPMTMLMRENAVQANLVRWDDAQECYVLTSAGRRRISARTRNHSAVLPFKKRDLTLSGALRRKSAKSRLDE